VVVDLVSKGVHQLHGEGPPIGPSDVDDSRLDLYPVGDGDGEGERAHRSTGRDGEGEGLAGAKLHGRCRGGRMAFAVVSSSVVVREAGWCWWGGGW